MKLDLRALGTFNRLAHEGAEHAAESLGTLTKTEPRVETTSIDLVAVEDMGDGFGSQELVGVRIGFEGAIVGQAVLAVHPQGARTLVESLPGESDPGVTESRMAEVGNILIGGFLDGWGDYLGRGIDITPPTYVEGTGSEIVLEGSPTDVERDQVFAFTSEIEAETGAVEVFIYLLPEADTFEELVAGPRGGNAVPVPLDKLIVFNHMTKEGASRASDNITTLTGIETSVEVSNLSFVPVEAISGRVDDETHVGVVIECLGLPGGYVVILFDEPSARTVAEELVPTPIEGEEIGEMHKSAIKEIGNIMTSGFIDGWANVLESTIDITPPKFVHDEGPEIFDPIASRISRSQEFAFVIDSTLVTTDRQISCNIYSLPDEDQLARALNSLSVDQADVDVSKPNPVPGMDARYEDL